jgi:hypothetical protein
VGCFEKKKKETLARMDYITIFLGKWPTLHEGEKKLSKELESVKNLAHSLALTIVNHR